VNVFITGASSGIGEGLARHYGAPGNRVGVLARRAPLLAALAEDLRAAGAEPHVYAVDVTDTAAVAEAARDFSAHAGGVELVIANAGIGQGATLLRSDPADIATLMRVNVIGVTNTVLPFVPGMVRQGSGVLVAVSSMAGHRALPGRGAYSASKAAVTTFMDGLRMELHGTGVHAMTLCPGFVKTPLTAGRGQRGMPFLMELPDALRASVAAIDARVGTATFPWPMRALVPVVRHAPEWVVRRLAPRR